MACEGVVVVRMWPGNGLKRCRGGEDVGRKMACEGVVVVRVWPGNGLKRCRACGREMACEGVVDIE